MLFLFAVLLILLSMFLLRSGRDHKPWQFNLALVAFHALLAWTIARLVNIAPVPFEAQDGGGAVVLVLVTGMSAVALCIWGLALSRLPPWRHLGAGLAGVVGGLALSAMAADHWWFFRDGAETGWTSPVAIGATDVPCQMALVRIDESDVEYRCAGAVVFNALGEQPFVPWPGYETGRSVDLKFALKSLQDRTVKIGN